MNADPAIAALIGSCIILYVWQMLHPKQGTGSNGGGSILPPGKMG